MGGINTDLKLLCSLQLAFLIDFTIGGLSGVGFAIVPIDWRLTDSYFVVAHIHYVFIGGSLLAVLQVFITGSLKLPEACFQKK